MTISADRHNCVALPSYHRNWCRILLNTVVDTAETESKNVFVLTRPADMPSVVEETCCRYHYACSGVMFSKFLDILKQMF